MSKALITKTSPPIIRVRLGSLGLCLGHRWGRARVLVALRVWECVWGSLRRVRLSVWLEKGTLSLRFPLLFHFVSKGTRGV